MSISVVIVEPGPDVRTTQSMQHTHEETHFLEVLNVLRNLHRGGMEPMSIAYTGNDCLITLSTDRADWTDYVDTRDPITGERIQPADEILLAERAIEMGLGTGAMTAEALAKLATRAGVTVVQRSDGRRQANEGERLDDLPAQSERH
jgi:hypothetical protein